MTRLAERLNRDWDAQMTLSSHVTAADALEGADFVVSAIEVPPREVLWRQDCEITLRHGVRQPYAENGGPGGFAHTLRNVGPVLEIAHLMERLCPARLVLELLQPHGAHLRRDSPLQRDQGGRALPPDPRRLWHGGLRAGRRLGHRRAARRRQRTRRPGHLAAAGLPGRPGHGAGGHQGRRAQPLHLDARPARPAHGRRPLPALPGALGGVRPHLRAAHAAGVRRLRPLPHSGRRAPVRIPAVAQRPGHQAVGEI